MPKAYSRLERIADLIQKTLSQILIKEASDLRFRFVTIMGVTVARDLGYAKVYVSMLEEDKEKIKQTVQALNRASKYLRYTLAHEVDLRVVPELTFVYDESTSHGFKIASLIDSALNDPNKKSHKQD